MKSYRQEIRKEARKRGISELFHFTPDQNVRSILVHGLASPSALTDHGIAFLPTDKWRLDERLDAVSTSIHSVNESMFEAKRKTYDGEWVIFALDASILWTHRCRFCWLNAATSEIRRHRGFMEGPWAFRQMFEDRSASHADIRSYRGVMRRVDCEPTSNAAEVQVLDPIGPDLIIGAVVKDAVIATALEHVMHEVERVRPVKIIEDVFR